MLLVGNLHGTSLLWWRPETLKPFIPALVIEAPIFINMAALRGLLAIPLQISLHLLPLPWCGWPTLQILACLFQRVFVPLRKLVFHRASSFRKLQKRSPGIWIVVLVWLVCKVSTPYRSGITHSDCFFEKRCWGGGVVGLGGVGDSREGNFSSDLVALIRQYENL